MSPVGFLPGDVAFAITAAIKVHAKQAKVGRGIPNPVAFTVPELSSGRETFSPDAAYSAGSPDEPRRFAIDDAIDAEPVMPGWRLPLAEIFADE